MTVDTGCNTMFIFKVKSSSKMLNDVNLEKWVMGKTMLMLLFPWGRKFWFPLDIHTKYSFNMCVESVRVATKIIDINV